MSNKRFQECSKLEQIWRYRWYLLLPFKWIQIKYNFIRYKNEDPVIYKMSNKDIWKLCKGMLQGNMKWHYTQEEVFAKLKSYKDRIKEIEEKSSKK